MLAMDEEDAPQIPIDGPGLRYMAVADYITEQVDSGKLPVGAKLSSERDLAEEYGVAYLTVRRAMKELRERGIIVTVHGRGTFVAAPSDTAPTGKDDRP